MYNFSLRFHFAFERILIVKMTDIYINIKDINFSI